MKPTSIGDCEACVRTNTELFKSQYAGMLLCLDCLNAESKAITDSNQVVIESRKVDSLVELEQDLFNAGTVSFIEIQAAIQNNPAIPAEKKNYALIEEVDARIKVLSQAIFDEEKSLIAKRNARQALTVNAQTVVAKLHERDQAKWHQYNINYKPAPVKKPSTVVKSGKAKFDKKELIAVAQKFGFTPLLIQRIAVQKNMSALDAALFLQKLSSAE